MSKLQTFGVCCVCLLLAAGGLFPSMAARAQGEERSSEVRRKGPRGELSEEERSQLVRKIWWNQSGPVEALKLEAAQRGSMDELLEAFLQSQDERREGVRQAQSAFSELLESGRLPEAREAITAISEASGAVGRAQAELKVDVLELLTPKQRAKVREEYPHLLRNAWVRMGLQVGGDRQDLRSRIRSRRDG